MDDSLKPVDALTERVIGLAMKVHRTLGSGFLESVYHKALEIELAREQIPFASHKLLQVHYEGVVIGTFEADLIAGTDPVIIIEIKSVDTLAKSHEVQLVNYLTATGIDVGLLINFGSTSLQVRRKHRLYKPKSGARDR